MRPIFLATSTLLAALVGLGSAVAAPAPSDSCTASCASSSRSADDRATCRLQCEHLAQVAASPAPASSKPVAPPARPVAAAPAPAQPVAASPEHQRSLCESQCDAEPVVSDRATCRLQCGQLARVAAPPVSTTTSTPAGSGQAGATTSYSFAPGGATTGSTTSYSFAPGGGRVPVAPAPSAPSAAPAQAATAQAATTPPQAIAACQATCDREASPTDRATCRNNCGAVGTVLGPAAPGKWVLGPAPASSDAEQRAAVIRSSQGVVGGAVAPPPATTTVTRVPTAASAAPPQPVNPQCAVQLEACGAGCGGEQSSCATQCEQGKLSSTDRATCKLTCESNGDMCRDDCRIKEAACRGPSYR